MKSVMDPLMLKSGDLESLMCRLSELASSNASVASLAYAGSASGWGCGCKGSCDGGCTSW